MVFFLANVRVMENRHGKIYNMGKVKPYPQVIQENVLDLHNNSLSINQALKHELALDLLRKL